MCHGPCRVPGRHCRARQYRQWQERRGLVFCGPSSLTNYMPSNMPMPPAQQASMQAEREELARQRHDLEARALNLNAVRDAKVKAATSVAGSSHSRSETGTLETQTC